MSDQLEGRNPVLEALQRNRRKVYRIWLDSGAKPDSRVRRILEMAGQRGVPVQRVDRAKLDKRAEGRVHNGVIAHAEPLVQWTATGLLQHLLTQKQAPFIVVADELAYEHNLGAILRSSLGFGVDGLFLPSRRGAGLSPVVQRVSMGAVEEVAVVRESLFSSLKQIKKAGIPLVGADMGGRSIAEVDLSGPLALVMGAEGRGLSDKAKQRCDRIVSIPLAGGLESLNVSVAAALVMYEKRRQDGWFS